TIKRWDRFVAILVFGMGGLAGAATLLAALVAKTTNRSSLFVVLAFPILLPVMVCAINGTIGAFLGTGTKEAGAYITVLAVYLLAMVTASLMLFDYVWDE